MSKGRKEPLISGKTYHIFSKSIAGFEIFRNNMERERMESLFQFYKKKSLGMDFSSYNAIKNDGYPLDIGFISRDDLVEIAAYCVMTTHFHLIVKQLVDGGISTYMSKILNSYSRYFNIKTKRKGPLWESRFGNVLIDSDEQFLHVTRYIHLNPATAGLVENPEHWVNSSYLQFLGEKPKTGRVCVESSIDSFDMSFGEYREFVESRIDYQRELARLKVLFLD